MRLRLSRRLSYPTSELAWLARHNTPDFEIPSLMPRIPFLKIGHAADEIIPPKLSGYVPALSLEGLQVGIDNLRYDVHLSSRFVEQARVHVARLIARDGNVTALLEAEVPEKTGG